MTIEERIGELSRLMAGTLSTTEALASYSTPAWGEQAVPIIQDYLRDLIQETARRCADSVRDKAITHMEAATRLKREGVQDWALIDRFEAKGGALMRASDELREFALAGREGEEKL